MCIILWAKFVGSMSEDGFEVVVHHSEHFVRNGKLWYDDGERVTWLCDPDTWSYFKILNGLKELGHINPKELWYSVGGESMFEDRLVLLVDDKWAMHMATIAMINGVVHLYVVHMMTEPKLINMIEGLWLMMTGRKNWRVIVKVKRN